MKKKQPNPTYNILLESELETKNVSINDIKKEIKDCEKMIKRCEYKKNLYKRKLATLNNQSRVNPNVIKKGLSLFNLTKKISKNI